MPWNDTAQLNFLLPRGARGDDPARSSRVARTFRIIRFDAAMTLAKKHFQRLWYPQPGGGAGVPSRAEHAMSREEFDRVFPVEFWREVVDRVAAEVPDTLLLAEAFWLMEGYFVRTLGMHRVYNSAFMNMLKTEDNAKYRRRHQEHPRLQPRDPQALRQFHEQPRRGDRRRAVRHGRQVLRGGGPAGHHAGPADVRPRPGRRACGRNTAWNTAGPTGTRRSTRTWSATTRTRSSP